ncbi:AAA family ATPase, partial [Helicobacter pylori]|uniref:AAA family ATPase n=1 Tax=Helicobacter pylori TaxID=210 RepID=UPI001301B8DF
KIKNKESLKKNTQDKEKEEKDFTDSCWEKLYKKFEEDFKETLEGFKCKEKFKEKILNEFKDNKHNQSEQSEMVRLEELKEKIGIVFNKNQTELALLECNLTDFDSIENHSIWEQKIVGSGGVVIADLIKKLSNEDWVAQGREYVKDNSICPFCQKETITEEFKKQLESYLDTNYQESTDTIKKMK